MNSSKHKSLLLMKRMTQRHHVACVKVTLNSYFRKCRVSTALGAVNDPFSAV